MKHRNLLTAALAVIAAMMVGLVGAAAQVADADVKCESAKLKEVAKYSSCRLKADAKGVQTNTVPDFSVCEEKFWLKFESLDTKFGAGVCPTEGFDAALVNARVTEDENTIALLLSGARYVDNGDGTVTDLHTGLMWQKTDDNGGLTDKDNTYSWTDPGDGDLTDPDGTAFTVFLAGLNNCATGSGLEQWGFNGHCDWRLPQISELMTILLEPVGATCGTDPCIDQIVFGPTNAPSFYWSATSLADMPFLAAGVVFSYTSTPQCSSPTCSTPAVEGGYKDFTDIYSVRAVRSAW